MITLTILGASILLQLVAALVALRLVRSTGWLPAWLLIASALTLMAARRSVTFFHAVFSENAVAPDLAPEIVALVISVVMLIGVSLIRPILLSYEESEDSLKKSEATYRSILDEMTDMLIRTNEEGRIGMASRSTTQVLGYSMAELKGRMIEDLFVSRAERKAVIDALERGGGRLSGHESRLRHKDGSEIQVEISAAYVVGEDGEILGVEETARDISERKRTEKINTRLGRIIENSLNEIYVFDGKTLKFVLVNRGARENLGYGIEELRNLTPIDLKPEFTQDGFEELVRPLRDGSRETLEFETIHRRKDGSCYDVGVRLQLARNETPPVFFAIIEDTTERKLTEENLAQALKMEALGQLTGGVAHDFNNLLSVIMGNAELLEHAVGNAGPEARDLVAGIVREAGRGAELTGHLLAFSRKQALQPRSIDLNANISKLVDIFDRTLGETVEVRLICAQDLWRCEVDPSQLENAVLNLAVNGRDAMPSGGKLTIETRNVTLDEDYASTQHEVTAGNYVMLAVTDTGTGMPHHVLDRAFEPFFTTKEAGKGSGLGLSMVFGFAKQSGGHLAIYSEEGQGTTVRLYLPRTLKEIERSEPAGAGEPRARNETVLVVEDDPNLRAMVVRLLGTLGYATLEAQDAKSGLATLEEGRHIDLLLTDLVLPGGVGGFDLAQEASRRDPDLRVLYMSGYTANAIAHQHGAEGGVAMLQKPFRKKELAQKVREALDQA